MDLLLRKLLHYFNLDGDIDSYDKIHEAIERDVIFKGTNLWILVFAIIVASVGLNMNSTAVVIGAMLISPLMGPINGMGYSVATYNFPLFRKSVKNFGFAVSAGLIASSLYFAISPVSTAHSELLARTSPTIYDVLIALFGGLAGIVAISSTQKGNVIPGVAIATALMPPLCTAGYGVATAQFNFFFGALYLFAINTVFIGISSIAVSQILKFPIRTVVDSTERRRINQWITAIILITLVPSIYFGYLLVQKERFVENAGKYINNVSTFDGNYLLDQAIDPKQRTITLTYVGTSFSEGQKTMIATRAADFDLPDTRVIIQHGLSFDSLQHQISESQSMSSEIQRLSAFIRFQEQKQDSLQRLIRLGQQLLAEIKPLEPAISTCAYSQTFTYKDAVSPGTRTDIIIFGVTSVIPDRRRQEEIERWLKARLQSPIIKVYYEK